jgi:hypothetical protein
MYPTIVIDRDLIAEAHRIARERRRTREAAAAAQARAARPDRLELFRAILQGARRAVMQS